MLIDDTLLLPMRGLLWVLKQVHRAALEEREGEAQACTTRLTELYMMLEAGQITEGEFDAAEKELLDRIEQLEAARSGGAESDEGDGDEADDDDEDDEDDDEDDDDGDGGGDDEEDEDEDEEIDEDEESDESEDPSERRDTAPGEE
jgi:hypothetical protein